MNMFKNKYARDILFWIFVFSVSNAISNAAVSISFALLILCVFFDYKQRSFLAVSLDKGLYIPWFSFLMSILLAALLLKDIDSIKVALDYIYLSLPFIVTLTFYACNANFRLFLLAIATSLIIIGLKSVYVFIFVNNMSNLRVITFDPNLNGFGTLIALSLPFVGIMARQYYKKDKLMAILIGASFLLGTVGVVLTGSRGAIFSFVISGIVTAVINTKMIKKCRSLTNVGITVFLGLVILIGFMKFQGNFQRSYDSQRILFSRSSYAMWKDNKLIGVGLSNWKRVYYDQYKLPEAYEKNITMPHNTVAYFFSTSGILGGLGFLFFTFGIMAYLCNKMREQPDNMIIQAMLWSFLTISIQGIVDAGITIRIAFRLFSVYMGVTVASILLYAKRIKHINKGG